MTKATILQPNTIINLFDDDREEHGFFWDELYIQPSTEKGAGFGVFAKKKLPIGTMIPILGKRVESVEGLTHGWEYYRSTEFVDGNPSLNPFDGIGNYGLSIAMMVNETTSKKFNCHFKLDHVVAVRDINKDEELFVDYGTLYEVIRKQKGYTLDRNPFRFLDNSKKYHELKYPTQTERKMNIKHWNDIIFMMSRCDT